MHVTILLFLLLPYIVCKSQKDADVDSFDGVYFDRRAASKRTSLSRSSASSPSSSSSRWSNTEIWTGNQLDNLTPARSSPQSSSGPTPLAENIRCTDKNGVQSLTATITPPPGFANVPVFEDAVTIHPTTNEECSIKAITGHSITFSMKISNFIKCGVTTQKSNDGKEWLAISIRFPYVGGLRTSDDEHVMIMCRPQERTVTKSHIMDLRSNLSSQQRTIFSSGPSELDTKVSMFTKKSPSSSNFNEELSRNSLIEVGQDLQFRCLVRSGDGWKYAKLKDLTIQKITSTENNRRRSPSPSSGSGSSSIISHNKITSHHSSPDSALLVMEDGCRNPVYSAIAPKHPFPDSANPLVVNFAFKAFMFQDMSDGDTLRITAKIMACQESADCQPGLCLDDEMGGFGRRRRRRNVPGGMDLNHSANNNSSSHRNVHDWTREFELNVVMPGYVKAYASTGETVTHPEDDMIVTTKSAEIKCRQVVFLTASMSGIFVIVTTIAASVVLRSKQNMIDKCYSDIRRPSPVPSLPASCSSSNTIVTSRSSITASSNTA